MTSEKPDSSVKAVLVVVIIAAACAAGLAFVKKGTAEAITEALRAETLYGVGKVVPADCKVSLEKAMQWPEGESDVRKVKTVYPAYREDGTLCALAVRTRNDTGYSGKIVLLAGFKGLEAGGKLTLTRIYVLEHAETPGLGSKVTALQDEDVSGWKDASSRVFGLNFLEKPVAGLTFNVVKNSAGEGDVMAVTAATISSRAVTAAVQDAATVVQSDLAALKAKLGGSR